MLFTGYAWNTVVEFMEPKGVGVPEKIRESVVSTSSGEILFSKFCGRSVILLP
jgi:hypothetical protein